MQGIRLDTPQPKGMRILGSTSPLSLDPSRYLGQRWFSPQALTFGLPDHSCTKCKICLPFSAVRLVPMNLLPTSR